MKQVLNNTLWLMITIAILIFSTLFILGYLPYKIFIVQSGSMEPAIMTGDVIVVKKNQQYQVNQVVTFADDDQRIVTHRINGQNQADYLTKGDANLAQDHSVVRSNQIIGLVILVLPKLGYMIRFSKTLPGLIMLFFIPAAYLVYLEIINISFHWRKKRPYVA